MRTGLYLSTPDVLGDGNQRAHFALDANGYLKVNLAAGSGPAGVAGTATVTSVADNAASVTLLAANTSRKGATITNDSTAVLYVKCGTTATTTDYTVQINTGGYWEAPFGYTGRIDGIWATDPGTGAARITEFT